MGQGFASQRQERRWKILYWNPWDYCASFDVLYCRHLITGEIGFLVDDDLVFVDCESLGA